LRVTFAGPANLGRDIAQGHFVAKPMAVKAFEEWVLEWRPPE